MEYLLAYVFMSAIAPMALIPIALVLRNVRRHQKYEHRVNTYILMRQIRQNQN